MSLLLNIILAVLAYFLTAWVCHLIGLAEVLTVLISLAVAIVVFLNGHGNTWPRR